MIRRVVFRPAAVRDPARLDRVVQARIDAALVRIAVTGHGDARVLGIDNLGEAYRSPTTPDDLVRWSAEGQAKEGRL